MALQPAAGARDLNPREVESNRWLCDQLAQIYRLWGYAEVAPPAVERLETLEAGGGISGLELVRLAADEPLGLRPEMTASIARAACTRLATRPRPLRLWSSGVVFRSGISDSGQHRLEEKLQSGVELLGAAGPDASTADVELLALLLACLAQLNIAEALKPRLLLGHHGLLSALLDQVPDRQRTATRKALTSYDPLALAALDLPGYQGQGLQQLMRLRGEPDKVLYQLEQQLGPSPLLKQLATTLKLIAPLAQRQGIQLHLDPSFQPHYNLYDGLVLQLVCQGADAPVAIASGGRYDALLARFGGEVGGLGFSFEIGAIRELLGTEASAPHRPATTLVSFQHESWLAAALTAMQELHQKGERAELMPTPCASEGDAQTLAAQRGCSASRWLGGPA
ncbi:MAG: ATP phosphoribosyltransferase regulatory subunit [Synechococcus sp.]|nr:ATP phosphoribosyltransferase regulatory subunit [Synechococcus sp.]